MSPAPAIALRHTLFIAREIPYGRETLRRLARERGALVGWQTVTLRSLAQQFAEPKLAAAGIRVADDVLLVSTVDEVIDRMVAAGTLAPVLASQAETLGVRTAVWDAVAQLRLAGITPGELDEVARAGSAAAAIVPVLAAYERLLDERGLGDAATVFQHAIKACAEHGDPFTDTLIIEPGAIEDSGLRTRFIDALVARGAQPETPGTAEPTFVAEGLTLDVARAATPMDEVRHALRTALQEGLRWDEVELAATDADTYGVALASLAGRLGIPFTLKEGVPLARVRVGAALDRYLEWLAGGLYIDSLRSILEHGDLRIQGLAQDPSAAARTLRTARIGWGRARWEQALARFDDGSWAQAAMKSRDDDLHEMDEDARRAELVTRAADAARVIRAFLAISPPSPELDDRGASVLISVPTLAGSALDWLTLFERTVTSADELATVERLRVRLSAIAEHSAPAELPFEAALATLRQGLGDLRAFPTLGGERAPRTSLPGHLHLTDVTHAGVTGRRRVFVLGLDADRAGGARIPDPILDDRTRELLGAALPTTARRAERRALQVGRALAGLTGRVTLSYSTAADGVGREASPSAWLLAAWRATTGRPELSYDEFRQEIGAPHSAVPGSSEGALDRRDVWLGALASGSVTLDGVDAVDAAFPVLRRGFTQVAARTAASAGEWHGLVADAAGKLGPIARPEVAISPSSLEQLAECPLKWFYQRGLGLREPDDVEFTAGEWLDARQKGSLLHEVFERFVSEWKVRTGELAAPEAMTAARAMLTVVAAEYREAVPPPSAFVFERELRALEQLVGAFLDAEREDFEQGRTLAWRDVERRFPVRGAEDVHYDLGDGRSIRITGFIDRIDAVPGGKLRVVDYKTGSSYKYRRSEKQPPCNGGRHLQPALYAAGAEHALGTPVGSFEYRFPKERAPGNRQEWAAGEFAAARAVVRSLITHPERGEFVPTDDSGDCRFCAYASVCRVTVEKHHVSSPRAAWSNERGEGAPEFVELRLRRGREKE